MRAKPAKHPELDHDGLSLGVTAVQTAAAIGREWTGKIGNLKGVETENTTETTESMSHPEIFGFQDVIKIKNKTTIFL